MFQAHKTSSLIILLLIFLLPLFFIPGGALNLLNAKSVLLLAGVIAALFVLIYELWRKGSVSFPRHYFLAAAALLPAVYLLSALLSTPSSLSLFGYSFEVGTFGYMLIGSSALVLSAMVFADTSRALQALVAFFLSLSLIAVFVMAKVFLGADTLVWGNFFGNMGNPVGNWTDLAVVFGLLSVFTALVLGMIPMKSGIRLLSYLVFFLSTALLIIINFSTAFIFTLVATALLFLYFTKIEDQYHFNGNEDVASGRGFFTGPLFLPALLAVVSLVFLVNPNISAKQGTLGNVVARTFGIENTEVRPSFSATLGISKAVLSQAGLLGSGPNTFSHDWLIYKPAGINTTPFWSVAFPFGVGFIPTQIASTGILGSALWLAFFILLIALGIKALSHIPESRAERFTVVASLLASFFLWAVSFLYVPSGTVLWLAFIFSGLFVASLAAAEIIPTRTLSLRISAQNRFVSLLFLSAIVAGAAFIGWTGFEKTVSAYHFKKAVDLSNSTGASLLEVENELIRATQSAPADIHYVALSRLNFTKAQIAASATTSPEENRALFEDSLARSIEAARLAVSVNSAGYQNWVALGNIYGALVAKPLAVEGAYENARFAFSEALKRNPSNPEIYLLLAQLELSKDDVDAARSYVRNAIALKEDYADAYLMLAQLEVGAGNAAAAIASAEKLALLVPNNAGLYFELGVLRYSNKDYAGAEKSLNQALVLSPEYANAKYYLGLTLAELGRFGEALAEFEDLSRTNPNNADIEAALEAVRKNSVPTSKTQTQ
ncbi:MAG: hypothetical protein UY54_C0018G0002 [Parcubacteria group bacterium GW2011_GWA2_50_10b]|nr:MAG: hypothetical protein UY54_C0018G0002 [Parcubacteria group bacterium GW2011_GWA2_50_10b]